MGEWGRSNHKYRTQGIDAPAICLEGILSPIRDDGQSDGRPKLKEYDTGSKQTGSG